MMLIKDYLAKIQKQLNAGHATEHTHRPALQDYLENLYRDAVVVTNEPARTKSGAPDYILQKKIEATSVGATSVGTTSVGTTSVVSTKSSLVPVGYIEAKDVGKDLDKLQHDEQLTRYREGLDNLIFTDYLNFIFYKKNKINVSPNQVSNQPSLATAYEKVRIASYEKGKIIPIPENFEKLENLLQNFITYQAQTITSAKDLAVIMAAKAKLMRYNFMEVLQSSESGSLKQQMKTFQEKLIQGIDNNTFASMYAETITYGLFTARLNDKTPDTFSRAEAYDLIPNNNPFLKDLFIELVVHAQDNIRWSIDELCEILKYADVYSILTNYGELKGSVTGKSDPIIHFYEDFVKELDPKKRKSLGVYYTPEPVVHFIIRAVDEVLKNHFNLSKGIADSCKIQLQREITKRNGDKDIQNIESHKVQLLDVATGTGTFITQVIKHIYENYYKGQQGMWSGYVNEDLFPRLHGFESSMASYAMCHLKVDLYLKETGYSPTSPSPTSPTRFSSASSSPTRLGVYLTNSLEEAHGKEGDSGSFAQFLTDESQAASAIKRDTPVMVAFGNPPYSGESQNKNDYIMDLMKVYKQEPSGGKLEEKNPKWINDDYVKFIRLGEHFIEKNGEGVLAYITNHGYLDNPTFRGMRYHLLNTFDHIYIIDLHGNSLKKETTPDGHADQNVFDIMVGVAIIIAVKTKKTPSKKLAEKLATVYHADFWGNRSSKYQQLWKHDLKSLKKSKQFTEIKNIAPNYLFIPKDYTLEKAYKKGFSVNKLFSKNSVGIVTAKDAVLIAKNKDKIKNNIIEYYEIEPKDEYIKEISYRPFDNRFIYYDVQFVERTRNKIMRHMLVGDNVGLVINKQVNTTFQHCFISNTIIESSFISNKTKEINYLAPLYLYPDTSTGSNVDMEEKSIRIPNLNEDMIKKISKSLGLPFISDHTFKKPTNHHSFSPLDILDYIYAVLHSPHYRTTYAQFLKSDFPSVPYPNNPQIFWKLVKLGGQLRHLHLLEGDQFTDMQHLITSYPEGGDNMVESINQKSFVQGQDQDQDQDQDNSKVGSVGSVGLGRVYINKTQYFANVPRIAWEFFIGGYQPAQKWLKDRKGKKLSHDDILHYQHIILSLYKTHTIMKKIDTITDDGTGIGGTGT